MVKIKLILIIYFLFFINSVFAILPEWDFLNSEENWTGFHDLTTGTAGASVLNLNITGTDPYMFSPMVNDVDASEYKFIKIILKNETAQTNAQLYWITTSDNVWNEAKRVDFLITANDTDFKEYVLDLSGNTNWANTIIQLRFDPLKNGIIGGTVKLDYIKVENKKEWYFLTRNDGWTLTNNINGSVANSIYTLNITGSDPYMHSPDNLSMDASQYKYIRVRMKNATSGNGAQFYWITESDSVWNTAKHVDFAVVANDSKQREYVVDLSGVGTWSGTIRQIRFDPPGSSGVVELDYIKIEKGPGIMPGNTYKIAAKHSGLFVTVAGNSSDYGANIEQRSFNGWDGQRWLIEDVGDNFYKFTAVNSGLVFDIYSILPDNGTNLQQWEWWGGDCQKFKIDCVDSGYYRISAKHSSRVLDVEAASNADGANIYQWMWIAGENQKWSFTQEMPTPTPTYVADTARFNFEDGTMQNWYLDITNGAQGISVTNSSDVAIGLRAVKLDVSFTSSLTWNQAGIAIYNQIPSQTVSAKVYLPSYAPTGIYAKMFLQDANWQWKESSLVSLSPGLWTNLIWDLSAVSFNNPVNRLGVAVGSSKNYNRSVYIDSINFIDATFTITPTITRTRTPTITQTITITSTQTITKTITATITSTITPTITRTTTPTVTKTITQTITQTVTQTVTPTITVTITNTVTRTITQTITRTVTATITSTITQTVTPTITNTPVYVDIILVSNYDLMPVSVSTGQKDVYAVMFTLTNPSGGQALIKGITFTVKDGLSNNLPAKDVITNFGIRDENTFFYSTSLISTSSEIYCPVPAGIYIAPYSEKNLYVVVEITGNTINRASDFKIDIDSPFNIIAEDFIGGNTLPVTSAAGFYFPMGSSVATIQNKATELSIDHLNTMPVSVSTDQENVKAMELQMVDIGNSLTASIKVSRMNFYIRDAAGNSISVASAIKKLKITNLDGSFIYGEADAGSSNKISVLLSAPLIIPSTQIFSCAVMIDINGTYYASSVKVSLELSGDIYAVDANSNVPVIISTNTSFPKQTSAATIQEKVSSINLDSFTALLPAGVVKGQQWVELFDFRVYDSLGPLSAKAEFNSITVTVKNSSGLPLSSNSAIEKFYITDNLGNTLGSVYAGVDSNVCIKLLSPYQFVSGQSQYFRVFADILPTAFAPDFKVALQNTAFISVTDFNSKEEAEKIVTPNLPWETGVAGIFTAPATDLFIWHNGNIAPTMAGMGQPDVKFMILSFFNPGHPGTADIAITGITLTVKDINNTVIAPSQLLESVFITNTTADTTYAFYYTVSETAASSFYVPFIRPIFIDAQNTKNAYLTGNVALYAIENSYKLEISDGEYIKRNSFPEGYLTITATNFDNFPFASNPVTITALAYDFKVKHKNLMPVSIVYGDVDVPALGLNFSNYNAVPIYVTSLAVAIKNCDGVKIPANSVITSIKIKDRENNLIATANADEKEKIDIKNFSFLIPSGAEKELKIFVDTKDDTKPFFVEIESGDSISTLPKASVNPAEGDYFGNMKSSCVAIQSKNLEESYHIFPNPFNPDIENAKIEYYLENDASVTIKIYTIAGNLVKNIKENELKTKGLHYEDIWDGKNSAGKNVKSGIYICFIKVKYTDGNEKNLKRKIVVLR